MTLTIDISTGGISSKVFVGGELYADRVLFPAPPTVEQIAESLSAIARSVTRIPGFEEEIEKQA